MKGKERGRDGDRYIFGITYFSVERGGGDVCNGFSKREFGG